QIVRELEKSEAPQLGIEQLRQLQMPPQSSVQINPVLELLNKRPLDLRNVLWNWEKQSVLSSEERWQWIDRATTLFRVYREVIPITPARVISRILGRYWIMFNPDGGLLQSRLLTTGWWELDVTEALAHAIREGDTVVDVGANIGYYTLLMADLAGPKGHVF